MAYNEKSRENDGPPPDVRRNIRQDVTLRPDYIRHAALLADRYGDARTANQMQRMGTTARGIEAPPLSSRGAKRKKRRQSSR